MTRTGIVFIIAAFFFIIVSHKFNEARYQKELREISKQYIPKIEEYRFSIPFLHPNKESLQKMIDSLPK